MFHRGIAGCFLVCESRSHEGHAIHDRSKNCSCSRFIASRTSAYASCETDAGLHPLLARYEPSLIDALDSALRRGESVDQAEY